MFYFLETGPIILGDKLQYEEYDTYIKQILEGSWFPTGKQ